MSIKDFNEAEINDEAYVFRCPPDQEYAWVTNTEYFEDQDDIITIKRQLWKLVSEDEVIFYPDDEFCPTCEGDEVITVAGGELEIDCPNCKESPGYHPLAGKMIVQTTDHDVKISTT